MRAKNEFRLISEAYDIKLLAEKAVDGTLMCSKDCCGSPVMECKCGDDCPHCNCFMIQKAVKEYGLKSPLLEANDNDTVVVTRNYPADDPHSTHNTRISKKDLEKFKKMGYKIKSEDGEEDNEEPKRGITGHQHTDALAQAALSKDYLHKPYVSSYVGGESDGFRKIFAVLGSDGKVVHKTRDKQEAHQWLKDNYENIQRISRR